MGALIRLSRRVAVLVCVASGALIAQQAAEQPETVMITFRAKPGSEMELARVIARHWTTARELKLVRETPHVTIRGSEGERAYFVDIFTWRDAHTPDAAPAEILKIWGEMNRLVEARGGHAGIEFAQVSLMNTK